MSDFSTAYSNVKQNLENVGSASSALSSNSDPAQDAELIAGLLDSTEDLAVSDQDTSNALAEQQRSVGDVSVPSASSEESDLLATVPIKLTTSSGNERPRMAIDSSNNIWLTWHSNRTGSEEIYVAKYFGHCGAWGTSSQGGEEIRITNFGMEKRRALCPGISVGANGEVHVVFQGQDESGRWQVYYCKSTGRGISFSPPSKLTESLGNALMPDVAAVRTSKQDFKGSSSMVVVVWHDDRFGNFEIMAAHKTDGTWESSGQGKADVRVTQADGDSMFPRIEGDNRGNLRVVYHDSRRGDDLVGIYMSTFVSSAGRWESSGQGGADRLISNGPADSKHPDLTIDQTGGIAVAWHDYRDTSENPDQHEEVYALYCPRMGHPGVHYPPLQPNIEARLDVDLKIMDCVEYKELDVVGVPEVCLAIRAPNATFWRASNEDGEYSDWQEFKPNFDLETMVVPWTMICTGGKKQVCIQVQDAEMVGFPVCKDVTLALQPPEFKVEFFEDDGMTVALPSFDGRPVAKKGNVYVRLSTESPQVLAPKFDVIGAGQRLIFNQETEPLDVVGFSGAGIGSYIGGTVEIRKGDVSPAALEFSAAAGRTFKGRFDVKRHDGLFNVDGLARLIVNPRDLCGEVRTSVKQETAERVVLSRAATTPDIETDVPSNQLKTLPAPKKPEPDPHCFGCGPAEPEPEPKLSCNPGDSYSLTPIDHPFAGYNFGYLSTPPRPAQGRHQPGTGWVTNGAWGVYQSFMVSTKSYVLGCNLYIKGNDKLSVYLGLVENQLIAAGIGAWKITKIVHSVSVDINSDGSSPTWVDFGTPVIEAGNHYLIYLIPTLGDQNRVFQMAGTNGFDTGGSICSATAGNHSRCFISYNCLETPVENPSYVRNDQSGEVIGGQPVAHNFIGFAIGISFRAV